MQITSFEDLIKEAEEIQAYLDSEIPTELEAMQIYGSEVSVYISRTGQMVADAGAHKDAKMSSAIMDQLSQMGSRAGLPASTLNKLIDANCKEETRLLKWCERLNRSATHRVDWVRSLVSKEKERLRLEANGNFGN